MKISSAIKILSVCAVCAGFTACSNEGKEQPLHSVLTISPSTSAVAQSVTLPGVVKEASNVKAAFKSAGQLESVSVKEGDFVTKGQLIAVLDDVDYQIGVDAVETQYNQLKKEVERLRILYERNSISANEFEKAESGLRQLEKQLQAQRNRRDYTRLYAPTTGYVDQVLYHRGEMVDAGTPVLTIIDTSAMQIEVSLPHDIYEVRDKLTDFTTEIGGSTYKLTNPTVMPKTGGTQMYRMLLDLPADSRLAMSSGTNVNVNINLSEAGNADSEGISLPVSAIFYRADQPCVWVVNNDSTLMLRQIALNGIDADGKAFVTDGLDGDETIVKSGVNHLHEGEKVEIIPPVSNTNVGGLI